MKNKLKFGHGRQQFGELYQKGRPLSATMACKTDVEDEPLTDEEFRGSVLKEITTLTTRYKTFQEKLEELAGKIDEAPKEIKKYQEDLTLLKRSANDSQANFDKFEKQIKNFGNEMRRAVANHYDDPIEKFLADPEKRLWINAMVRKVANPLHKLPDELENALKAFTGVDSSLGQATIPTDWLPEIYSLLSEYGVFRTFGLITNISARTTTIPMATARPLYYWVGLNTGGTAEGAAITEGSFTGTSVNLVIQTLAAFIGVSRELIQDSSADMSSYITRELFQSIAFGLDWAALQADATADQTDGGYRGVFDAAALNTNMKATAGAGATQVGGSSGTILADWVRCLTTVNSAVLNRGPKWWMHPFTLAQTCLLVDNTGGQGLGRPLFQTALEAPAPFSIGKILGFPVILGDACPVPSLTGSNANFKAAVFGDPMGMAVGIRQDFEIATSTEFRFSQNQICYRALTRAGVQIKSAASSTTLKPFAVLTLAAS